MLSIFLLIYAFFSPLLCINKVISNRKHHNVFKTCVSLTLVLSTFVILSVGSMKHTGTEVYLFTLENESNVSAVNILAKIQSEQPELKSEYKYGDIFWGETCTSDLIDNKSLYIVNSINRLCIDIVEHN